MIVNRVYAHKHDETIAYVLQSNNEDGSLVQVVDLHTYKDYEVTTDEFNHWMELGWSLEVDYLLQRYDEIVNENR